MNPDAIRTRHSVFSFRSLIHSQIQALNTWYSWAVSHLYTEVARRCLTLVAIREPVFRRDMAVSHFSMRLFIFAFYLCLYEWHESNSPCISANYFYRAEKLLPFQIFRISNTAVKYDVILNKVLIWMTQYLHGLLRWCWNTLSVDMNASTIIHYSEKEQKSKSV